MPKKLTEEEVREIVEAIGYDAERLRYIVHETGYRDERGKMVTQKIIWEIISTGEVVEQQMSGFRRGSVPAKTNKEYENEVLDILKSRGIDEQYSFEVETGRHIMVHLTRLSDGQNGSIRLEQLRNGHTPKQFVYNYWDLESFRKHFSEVQPEISKYIEVVEYFPGEKTKVKLREISSGREAISRAVHVPDGNIPHHFNLSNHPQNNIPSRLYLCVVSEYSKKPGPFITVGIIRANRTTKQRYKKHLLKQILITEPQLNAVTTEKTILNQITDALGPPHAGNEAWLHTEANLKIITYIYNQTNQSNT
jgi:hypothetical protein